MISRKTFLCGKKQNKTNNKKKKYMHHVGWWEAGEGTHPCRCASGGNYKSFCSFKILLLSSIKKIVVIDYVVHYDSCKLSDRVTIEMQFSAFISKWSCHC